MPVINHPEAAILGMGAIKPRPVAVGDAVVEHGAERHGRAHHDLRADGAQAARFVCELRDLIESPETALLDL
ncbi:hypothetical protein MAHJHV57_50650 [Mycobacterium avium subsp. hominissuis]